MALAQYKPHLLSHAQERRRHQRVRVNLLGRYMLADRREYPCQVINMSPGGMAVIAPISGEVGERVIAYVDHLGRLRLGQRPALDFGGLRSLSDGRTALPCALCIHENCSSADELVDNILKAACVMRMPRRECTLVHAP